MILVVKRIMDMLMAALIKSEIHLVLKKTTSFILLFYCIKSAVFPLELFFFRKIAKQSRHKSCQISVHTGSEICTLSSQQ